MASFEGFGQPRTKYEALKTGNWYAYQSARGGEFLFLAATTSDGEYALRFTLDPERPFINAVVLMNRARIEAPADDVTDRLIIRPRGTGRPFELPSDTATNGAESIIRDTDGSLALLAKNEFGKVKSVNLKTGMIDDTGMAEAVFPAWEIYSLGDAGRTLVASFPPDDVAA